MASPAEIRVAFDSGWTDGDPGSGRVRLDTATPKRARFVYLNARDADDALLDQLIPQWGVGDVLVIERPGSETNRLVAWVTGPIWHGGSYYKIPIIVRTVWGGFAAHDEVVLTQHGNAEAEAPTRQALPDVRPMARLAPPPISEVVREAAPPPPPISIGPMTADPRIASLEARLAETEAFNQQLLGVLAEFLDDDRQVYVIEG